MTLGDRLAGRDNALNFVRLVLAALVIVSHSWPLSGTGSDPSLGGTTLGTFAVGGFFVASGYLVAASRLRTSFRGFLWRRSLRIYPAFWCVLVVTAVVFAPLSTLLAPGELSPRSAVSYISSNASLLIRQGGIFDTLGSAPYARAWNGSLWTLVYEFLAYLGCGVLVWLFRRHLVAGTVGVLLTTVALSKWTSTADSPFGEFGAQGFFLFAFFAAGMLVFTVQDRVRPTPLLIVGAALLTLLATWTGQFRYLAPIPIAILVLSLGALLPIRLGSVNDISYGVYVYAFPIQQLLAVQGFSGRSPWLFALVATGLVVPFAWASWRFIERPALRLKGWVH